MKPLTLLASRKEWASLLIDQVDEGNIPPDEITLALLRRIILHDDLELLRRVEARWGRIGQESQGLLKGRIRGVTSILGLKSGDSKRGREVFKTACAVCHKLNNEGNEILPDLAGATWPAWLAGSPASAVLTVSARKTCVTWCERCRL